MVTWVKPATIQIDGKGIKADPGVRHIRIQATDKQTGLTNKDAVF